VILRHSAAAALLLLWGWQPLAAQLKSVPVYPLVAAPQGWAGAIDYGSGLNDASGHARHLGVRVGGGTGRIRFTAAAGAWDAGATTSLQFGGTTLVRVMGGRSGGLALHAMAGAGYARAGPADTATTYWTFPVGVAVVHPELRAGGGVVTPWLTSRVEIARTSFATVRATQNGVGVSGGMAARVRGRFGLHVALDWLRTFERSGLGITLPGGNRLTAGVGVNVGLSGAP
jgi:hypothetical protein